MSEVLQNMSEGLAALVKTAGQSVVKVEARRRNAGSGILWSNEGIIVTANHVVERDEDIKVGLPDGKSVAANLVGRDQTTDVAILRLESKGHPVAKWAEPSSLQVGHLVLGLGRPGLSIQATLGVVSALGEGWRTPAGGQVDRYLQTDLLMYPGFSGGALVNMAGEIVGLNTSGLLRGLSIAVPAPTVRQVTDEILKHGKVQRGYLGVGCQPVRLPTQLRQPGQETGLLVISVESGSPADKAGVYVGDIIVALGSQAVNSFTDLLALLDAEHIGKGVPLRVIRGGNMQTLTATIIERE